MKTKSSKETEKGYITSVTIEMDIAEMAILRDLSVEFKHMFYKYLETYEELKDKYERPKAARFKKYSKLLEEFETNFNLLMDMPF